MSAHAVTVRDAQSGQNLPDDLWVAMEGRVDKFEGTKSNVWGRLNDGTGTIEVIFPFDAARSVQGYPAGARVHTEGSLHPPKGNPRLQTLVAEFVAVLP